MDKPLVSVLMTAYNREKYIAEAIESVMASTYENWELIIVDDCSSDNTVKIANDYQKRDLRIKVYVNTKNLGDYPNRNQAARYSNGKYLKYIDSDDIMYPHCLQVMVQAMEKFEDSGFGLSCISDSLNPYPIMIPPHQSYLEHFSIFGHFNRAPGSSIIKRSAFEKVDGFSGKRMIGDNELWFRLGRYYPLVKFPVDLYWSRIHSNQESQSNYAKKYEELRKNVIEDALSHKDCPLSSEEIKFIRKRMFKNKIKNKILNLLS